MWKSPELDDVIGVDGWEDEAAAAAKDETGVGELEVWGDADDGVPWLLPLPELLPEGTPGDDTWSPSCVPSAIGPARWAAQLPAGVREVA
jgi:hypothetical protein